MIYVYVKKYVPAKILLMSSSERGLAKHRVRASSIFHCVCTQDRLIAIRKWWTHRPHPLPPPPPPPQKKSNSAIFIHYTHLDKSFALLEMQAWVCQKLTAQSRVPCFEATLIRVVWRILRQRRRFQIPLLLVYLLGWMDCQVAFEPHLSRSQPPTTEKKE